MKKYTALEMRSWAGQILHDGAVDYYPTIEKIADMLRQAADMLGREVKYEYAAKSNYDGVVYPEHCDEAELRDRFHCMKCDEYTVVRREVGEWEEVVNEEV